MSPPPGFQISYQFNRLRSGQRTLSRVRSSGMAAKTSLKLRNCPTLSAHRPSAPTVSAAACSVGILPLGRECPQGGAEALAGKVGLTGFIEHQEAGVVDDELEAFGPGQQWGASRVNPGVSPGS